jgi:hypothetical protein
MKPGTRVRIDEPSSCFHGKSGIVVGKTGYDEPLVHLDGEDYASMLFGRDSVVELERPEPHVAGAE